MSGGEWVLQKYASCGVKDKGLPCILEVGHEDDHATSIYYPGARTWPQNETAGERTSRYTYEKRQKVLMRRANKRVGKR